MVKQQRENKSNNVVFVILGTLIVVVIVAGVLVGIAATLTSSTDVEETPRVYVDPDDLTVDKPIIYIPNGLPMFRLDLATSTKSPPATQSIVMAAG